MRFDKKVTFCFANEPMYNSWGEESQTGNSFEYILNKADRYCHIHELGNQEKINLLGRTDQCVLVCYCQSKLPFQPKFALLDWYNDKPYERQMRKKDDNYDNTARRWRIKQTRYVRGKYIYILTDNALAITSYNQD